jgi:TonB family protein
MKTLLGQYEILSELGSGGMGVVYRALDIELQREVALKRLRSEFAASPAVLERFRREAQLQGRLNHPNIAQLYSLAQTPDAFCIVMELIEGVALKTLIPMSWQEAGPILLQVLDGLGYAHSQAVLHRDIKPENILIDRRGTAKVMDFGIAHAVGAERLTREKALIGTIEYMPPERIQGGQVDNRSDIYSIGMVLFEVLTGRLPYSVTSEYEVMKWHVESAPPPLSHFIQAPAALDEIVQKASAKRPEDRFASCEDMAAALRLVCGTSSPDSRIVPVSAPNGYLAATHSVPAIEHPLSARRAAPTRLVDPEVSGDALPQTSLALETPEPTLWSSTDTDRKVGAGQLIALGAIVLLVVALAIFQKSSGRIEKERGERFRERQSDIAKGSQALLQKNYVLASEYFHQALILDPGNVKAEMGLLQIQQLEQAKTVRDNNLVSEQSAPPASGSGVAGLGGAKTTRASGPKVIADTPKQVNLSSAAVASMLLRATPPQYPVAAKAEGMSGTVILQFVITRNGDVKDLRVVSGPLGLLQASIDAVKTWKYRPYLVSGRPVEVGTTVSLVFNLPSTHNLAGTAVDNSVHQESGGAAPPKRLSISSSYMTGNLLQKTVPEYPAIAKAARIQGTVAIQATISEAGTIQKLAVISGPPLLRQSALDAVRTWRYKPYLLNGEPVPIETVVNVVFNLGG